jgi:endonuclease-3 related protein
MKPASRPQPDLPTIYRRLLTAFGPQHWWPAETPFEVMVGAILTQNAAWSNVERAIANLKRARKLNPRAILALSNPGLQRLIRPSGFFRVKAKRLRAFADYFVTRYQGSIARMRRYPLARLRPELLRVHGIGPETADSILLYALGKPSFVIDAYTRRILERHGLTTRRAAYDDVRAMFENSLPRRVKLYNEYHALFVRLAKTHCSTRPFCTGCPLSACFRPPAALGGRRTM